MDQSDISNYAELDFDRSGRCGFPEFIYGAGKTAEQIAGIMRKLEQSEVPVLATRVSGESAAAVCREIPEAEYDELARTLCIRRFIRPHRGHIAVPELPTCLWQEKLSSHWKSAVAPVN